jgi:hypothetical protein
VVADYAIVDDIDGLGNGRLGLLADFVLGRVVRQHASFELAVAHRQLLQLDAVVALQVADRKRQGNVVLLDQDLFPALEKMARLLPLVKADVFFLCPVASLKIAVPTVPFGLPLSLLRAAVLAKIETVAVVVALVSFFSHMRLPSLQLLRQKLGLDDVVVHLSARKPFEDPVLLAEIGAEILDGGEVRDMYLRTCFGLAHHHRLLFLAYAVVNGQNVLDENTGADSR